MSDEKQTRKIPAQFMHTADQRFNWKTTGNADFIGLGSMSDEVRDRYLWLADALLSPDSPLQALPTIGAAVKKG